jgi:predicted nucleic acid-binding protein
VTRAEVLAGARNPADRVNLVGLLAQFAQVPTPDSIWDEFGDNLNALRSGGVTVPFPDAILATLAIANDIELWTRDSHFTLMQRVLSRLKLFAEPP